MSQEPDIDPPNIGAPAYGIPLPNFRYRVVLDEVTSKINAMRAVQRVHPELSLRECKKIVDRGKVGFEFQFRSECLKCYLDLWPYPRPCGYKVRMFRSLDDGPFIESDDGVMDWKDDQL